MLDTERLQECEDYVKAHRTAPPSGGIRMRRFRTARSVSAEAEEYLKRHRVAAFTEQLFFFIDRTGQKDSEIYKKAYIDRRLFSKIRSSKLYIPAKKTILALCLALELPRTEADTLLSAAGYSLSCAEDYDLVIAYCIENRIFNFADINEVLVHFGFDTF